MPEFVTYRLSRSSVMSRMLCGDDASIRSQNDRVRALVKSESPSIVTKCPVLKKPASHQHADGDTWRYFQERDHPRLDEIGFMP
jgi:hypothetical protein